MISGVQHIILPFGNQPNNVLFRALKVNKKKIRALSWRFFPNTQISGRAPIYPGDLGTLHRQQPKKSKMLESRSDDALVLLVKLVKSTIDTVETVETVETEETVLTEDLKKYR